MKKQKTEVKKLRVSKETLLPLGSHQVSEAQVGYPVSPIGHLSTTQFIHA